MITVLSLFFVIGGIMVAKWLRARPYWIILLVLIPFFMSTTAMTYQISGFPASMALNSAGREYELWYMHDEESYAAKWIKDYGKGGGVIYNDRRLGFELLKSQAGIWPPWAGGSFISAYQEGRRNFDGYIFLRYDDSAVGRTVAEYPEVFAGKNKIYTTKGSEIYR